MYYPHTTCRACGYGSSNQPTGIKAESTKAELLPVLDLGLQPLANDFCDEKSERAGYAPLKVMLCPKCHLAQLSVVVNPEILYSRYAYQTSQSKMMYQHFKALWIGLNGGAPLRSVVEIGSNDGTFLQFIGQHDPSTVVLGIDPAENLSKLATAKGIRNICALLGKSTALHVRELIPDPDLVIARHVFCHVHDWLTLLKDIRIICGPNTLLAIEVPYTPDMIMKGSFDQVYHEHLSYLSAKPMQALADRSDFELTGALRFGIHGGVIVFLLRPKDGKVFPNSRFKQLLETEACGPAQWREFSEKSCYQIASLQSMVGDLRQRGKTVCGYGASAKATVWINACKFTRKDIAFVMDSTATKVYKFVPGTDIPVVHEGTYIYDATDYCVLFCWNYMMEVIPRERQYLDLGGKFIVPIPELEIVDGQTEKYFPTNRSGILAQS